MSNPTIIKLPFNQDLKTVRIFEFPSFRIYLNRAKLDNNTWISRKTQPQGIYTKATDGKSGFVHRITARVRNTSGVDYLQLIFFSWWVAVVRKDAGIFSLKGELSER